MINCEEFLHLIAEDELDLTRESRSERDLHAASCERCYRLSRGYRAYVSRKQEERKHRKVGRDAPWVKESLVRAANAAIDRMEAADRERVLPTPTPRVRGRALAVASSAVLIVATTLATEGGLALVSAGMNHPEVFAGNFRPVPSGGKTLDDWNVAPLNSQLETGK